MNAPRCDVIEYTELEPTPTDAARVNKWLCVFAYTHGYASHATTAQRFRAHPEWKDA